MRILPRGRSRYVETMVWLHDYGKILDFNDQYAKTLIAGRELLQQLGFPDAFSCKVIDYIEILDKKLELDLNKAPVEVKIVSSADGCSHMVGPFLSIFWNEATDKTFAGKEFKDLMTLNLAKTEKDWNHKIVLPEARKAFESRYKLLREQAGKLPSSFIK